MFNTLTAFNKTPTSEFNITEVENIIWPKVWNRVENVIWPKVWNRVENVIWPKVWNRVENVIWPKVWNKVENVIWPEVWSKHQSTLHHWSEHAGGGMCIFMMVFSESRWEVTVLYS